MDKKIREDQANWENNLTSARGYNDSGDLGCAILSTVIGIILGAGVVALISEIFL